MSFLLSLSSMVACSCEQQRHACFCLKSTSEWSVGQTTTGYCEKLHPVYRRMALSHKRLVWETSSSTQKNGSLTQKVSLRNFIHYTKERLFQKKKKNGQQDKNKLDKYTPSVQPPRTLGSCSTSVIAISLMLHWRLMRKSTELCRYCYHYHHYLRSNPLYYSIKIFAGFHTFSS